MKTYTMAEAARTLGVAENTVRKYKEKGKWETTEEIRGSKLVEVVTEEELEKRRKANIAETLAKAGVTSEVNTEVHPPVNNEDMNVFTTLSLFSAETKRRDHLIEDLQVKISELERENGELRGANVELRSVLDYLRQEVMEWRREARDARSRSWLDIFKKKEA